MTSIDELQDVDQRSFWQATMPAIAPHEGRPWFMPLAGEYWQTKDRLAFRQAAAADSAYAADV